MPRLRDYLHKTTQPLAPNQTKGDHHHTILVKESLLSPEQTKKLHDAFIKRVKEHGPRVYRWPDGTLQSERPPPNPYAVSNRARWRHLIHYCRTHGGDRSFDTTGKSLRYGINVPYEAHAEYMQVADLLPEIDKDGSYLNNDNNTTNDPLRDPSHAFNTFYRDQSRDIFGTYQDLGRLL